MSHIVENDENQNKVRSDIYIPSNYATIPDLQARLMQSQVHRKGLQLLVAGTLQVAVTATWRLDLLVGSKET